MKNVMNAHYHLDGTQFAVNPDGVVLWSSDWPVLIVRAYKRENGFTLRHGGPGTMGHTDIMYDAMAHAEERSWNVFMSTMT